MLNTETSVRVERVSSREKTSCASQAEVTQYIRDMVKDLQGMATRSGLGTLAYLLSLAQLGADEIAEELRRKRG